METGLNRNNMEKYYTKREIAKFCVNLIKPFLSEKVVIIEPSAGSKKYQ